VTAPRIIIATTADERDDAFSVRIAVFVDEQRIPRSEELDGFDALATHCVAYFDDKPVAAGRLVITSEVSNHNPLSPGGRGVADTESPEETGRPARRGEGEGSDYAKIGRMAVLASHRGTGLGALVLAALEREAAARGIHHMKLSAQLHARGFYERCGYTAHGDIYDDVGIPHIDMEKQL